MDFKRPNKSKRFFFEEEQGEVTALPIIYLKSKNNQASSKQQLSGN